MDRPICHVLYVNRNVRQQRVIRAHRNGFEELDDDATDDWKIDDVGEDIQPLLDTFGDVHVCATGADCVHKLFELQEGSMLDMKPTLVLFDLPYDQRIPEPRTRASSPSPSSDATSEEADIHTPDEDLYGLGLLQKINTEAHLRNLAKLVIPIAVISNSTATATSNGGMTDGAVEHFSSHGDLAPHRPLVRRCLDLGAVDVVISPLNTNSMATLEICAYRAHRDTAKEQQTLLEVRQGRKRSWVGVNEEKPFAYLREAMVSGLMNGICRLSPNTDPISHASIAVSSARRADVSIAVGGWHFCAHDFSDDELLVAAMEMFRHALAMPELEHYRVPADQLISFLVECRSAYNAFVPYHNFRHVVDVLQATFNFLIRIGALPIFPADGSQDPGPDKSPMAALVQPFEALTLLITAIGHDVGHPGVNNGFLVKLNAPLAQLYNDRSVLESFHCAAFSQILRRYWPAVFEDGKMRNLMISSILATDMQLHFDYMKKLGDVQEKLSVTNSTDGWNGRQLEENRALACSLLIKCADISNVARGHSTAVSWMHILSDEFARQATMEAELGIPSSLIAPPNKDPASMAQAQLGFMNLFAIPLFQGVADIMPAMQYTVDELEYNKSLFELKLQEEKAKQLKEDPTRKRLMRDGTFSPRTMSFAVPVDGNQKPLVPQPDATDRNSSTTPVAHLQVPLPPPPAPPTETDFNGQVLSPPTNQAVVSSEVPDTTGGYKDINGSVSSFDAVRELANSDPFHCRNRGDSYPDSKSFPQSKQRCSETTEGSVSGAFSGDWASQATSATTGKIQISPSTRGTSIASKDSRDHPVGIPGINISSPSLKDSPITIQHHNQYPDEDTTSNSNFSANGGSIGKAEGKTLRKKPSRFRMKDFPFFRRHKGTSSPNSAADSTG